MLQKFFIKVLDIIFFFSVGFMMKKLNTTIKVGLLGISLYATEMLGGDYRLGDIQIPDGFSVYSQQKLKKEMGLEEAREALAESCLRQAEWNRNFLGSLKDGTLELKSEDIEAFLRQYDIDVNKLVVKNWLEKWE